MAPGATGELGESAAPTSWLTLIATAGLNDTKYIDFPFNECPADRPNQDGDADPRCDASGRPFPFAPEWNATLTPLVRVPLSSLPGVRQPLSRPFAGIDLTADFTMEYLDVSYVDVDLDPRKRQPAFCRFRASIGLASFAQGWSFKLTGENLTDEATSIRDGTCSPACSSRFRSSPACSTRSYDGSSERRAGERGDVVVARG